MSILLCLSIIVSLILIYYFVIAHRELDDLHPLIPMGKDKYNKSKWLWIIPLYLGVGISEYPEWCDKIRKSGKILGMHGVQHTYDEFSVDVSEDYIKKGMEEFKKGFGYYPKYFKAPKLHSTKHNDNLIRKLQMEIKDQFNQHTHLVYHTEDYGRRNGGRLIGELETTY